MNREILFRGIVKYNGNYFISGDWIDGAYFYNEIENKHYIKYTDKDGYGNVVRIADVEVDPKTVSIDLYIQNRDQVNIYQNDIVLYNDKEYIVCYEGWRSTIERSLFVHGENETIVIDEDVAWECKVIGNIHDDIGEGE